MADQPASNHAQQKDAQGSELILPEPIDFRVYAKKMPDLGRPLRVALPCSGIEGCGEAMYQGGTNFEGCNVWDLEDGYKEYLENHFEEATGKIPELHLGKEKGDMLEVPLENLEGNVHLLVTGFPCPPWAVPVENTMAPMMSASVSVRKS